MGTFGYTQIEGIRGEVSTSGISIIRTFTASEDMAYGEPVQLDKTQSPESRLISLYKPNQPTLEPLLGVTIYKETNEIGYYQAGDQVQVLTFGDIRVPILDGGNDVFPGDQVFVSLKTGTVDPRTSNYEFAAQPALDTIVYGTFVTGGTSAGTTPEYVIHFDPFRTQVTQ